MEAASVTSMTRSIYPYSLSGSGRHSILQRFNIILVHVVSLFITCFPVSNLLQKSLFLDHQDHLVPKIHLRSHGLL